MSVMDAEAAAALAAPFPSSELEWVVVATSKDKTKGLVAPYVDARSIQARLDAVLGVGGWQTRFTPILDKGLACELSVRLEPGGEWIVRTDGAPFGDREAVKGAFSNAFKRAACMFGIGRYLYEAPKTWVPVAPKGKSWEVTEIPHLPPNFLPAGDPQAATAHPNAPRRDAAPGPEPARISPQQERMLKDLIRELEIPPDAWQRILSAKGVSAGGDLSAPDAAAIIDDLARRRKAAPPRHAPPKELF